MLTKIIAAGGIVINQKDEVLMMFRRGHWDLPKGKLDGGESIETCAVREVCEETGIKEDHVSIVKNAGITYHEYFDKYLKKDVLKETHWYYMQYTGNGDLVPQTEEDIEELKWVTIKEVPQYFNKTYKNIAEILNSFLQEKRL